jgi:hypothetical protein
MSKFFEMHKQVKTKYGFYVDEKMVKIIEILNDIPGLVTIESCQELHGEENNAWVCFKFGKSYKDLCDFVFDKLDLKMYKRFGDGIGYLSVRGTTNNGPIGELEIRGIKLMEEFLSDFVKQLQEAV